MKSVKESTQNPVFSQLSTDSVTSTAEFNLNCTCSSVVRCPGEGVPNSKGRKWGKEWCGGMKILL